MIIDSISDPIKKELEQIQKENPYYKYTNYQIEQLALRLYLCRKCIENGKCSYCSCNPLDVIAEPYSCNKEKVYPNLLNQNKWKAFKKQHNITIK